MQNQPLNFHQKYILQQGVQRVQTKLSPVENEIQEFTLNSIGGSSLKLSQEILNTSYKENKKMGRFILIDPQSNNTAAVGFIQ
jgi:sulfate adenylyltransferase subunit 1